VPDNYKSALLEQLREPSYAAEYLTLARAEGREVLDLALRDVWEAIPGINSQGRKLVELYYGKK